ncbi:hypothetical protein JCM10914A_39170 [Paenibacillus sp. JCM 10914]|uniref:hypothetical protein n=1 Tax=Paenibacillus sp. JCM 10914 TaxID=1236974 RepID=UPI000563C047|nr:hypothetical protein [Paenibacillus sp. JCM 10914]
MSQLSRMDRHQSRNKGRKNKTQSKKPTAAEEQRKRTTNHFEEQSGSHSSANDNTGTTKELRRSRSSAASQSPAYSDSTEESTAPKRRDTYSSYRLRVSKWFVNSLIIIFVLLMIGLLWWGLKGAPPINELLRGLI